MNPENLECPGKYSPAFWSGNPFLRYEPHCEGKYVYPRECRWRCQGPTSQPALLPARLSCSSIFGSIKPRRSGIRLAAASQTKSAEPWQPFQPNQPPPLIPGG